MLPLLAAADGPRDGLSPGDAEMLASCRHGVVRAIVELGMDVAMQRIADSVLWDGGGTDALAARRGSRMLGADGALNEVSTVALPGPSGSAA